MLKPSAKKLAVISAIAVWMVLNIVVLSISILSGDTADLNNWIEIALWITSIAGVLSMKKWGFAFAIFTLSYALSTSMSNVIYYGIWINAIRVMINIPIIIYLFRRFFAKSPVSVKGKLFYSGLNCVEVATRVQRAVATTIATTTAPAKGQW